jgi:hypothetical protein
MDRCLSPMGVWEIAVAGEIDRDKLRMAIRKLGNESIFYLLYDAIELMPPAKLCRLVKPYLDPESMAPDGGRPQGLLAKVKFFEQASLAGDYYDPFDVNSKNCMDKSIGTVAWIAECNRLLGLCVVQARTGDASEARQSFDIIFGLLDEIDACRDNVIFFADEAGAWQVGVDWAQVLPSWFKVLSAMATPEEYATRVVALLNRHCGYQSPTMLAVAGKLATPAQARALAAA